MTQVLPPAPAPEAAPIPPAPDPFNTLAYEPLMTRIKAAQLKPLFIGLLAAVGVMALGNVVMFALVQQAQQETVDFATKVAANAENGGEFEGVSADGSGRLATFGPLADLIESIQTKERQRDALLAQRPEYAGELPVANAPNWRAQAAQQLSAYEDQVDAQIALLSRRAAVASADSIAPSSLEAPSAAPVLPFPAPSSAMAKPAPVKQEPAKPAAAKRASAPAPAAKRNNSASYSSELTAALNRASRSQALAAVGAAADAPAQAAAPAPAAVEASPIATAAPDAPPAMAPASDQVGQ